MTTTQSTSNQTPAYRLYRCGTGYEMSASRLLTADEASIERDRLSRDLPVGVWIEMKREG